MEGGNGTSGLPDLQAILATLAQFSAPNTSAGRESIPENEPAGSPTPPIDQNALQGPPPGRIVQPTAAKASRLLRPQRPSTTASPRPMIDPASITAWPEALRCVTKIAAQNVQFAVGIQRMMKEQRDNEIRWYSERQNLKQVQANRSASAAKAHSILKSLNTSFYGSPPEAEEPEVDKENEMAEFDRKIYVAQQTMENAMIAELKSLGVPFFGTDQNLIVSDGYDVSKEQLPDSHPKWSPLVTEGQLMHLRRRMIGHLEDLFRE